MRFLSIIAIVASLTSMTAAWKCDLEDVRYLGQNATIVQTQMTSPDNSTVNMTISGTMRVTDACSFTIDNFIFLPETNDTFWYGIKDEIYNKGKVSDKAVVMHNDTSATFAFVDAPVARSWDDVDTLVLFHEKTSMPMAYLRLNLTEVRKIRNNTVPLTDDSTTSSTASATAKPTSTSTPKSESSGARPAAPVSVAYYIVPLFISVALMI